MSLGGHSIAVVVRYAAGRYAAPQCFPSPIKLFLPNRWSRKTDHRACFGNGREVWLCCQRTLLVLNWRAEGMSVGSGLSRKTLALLTDHGHIKPNNLCRTMLSLKLEDEFVGVEWQPLNQTST